MATSSLELAIGNISRSLTPVTDRAIRTAAGNNHSAVHVEHFVIAIIMEQRTKFETKGYHPQAVYDASIAKYPEFPFVQRTPLPEDLFPSPRLTEWINAVRKVAERRVDEHHSITLDDFFEAVKSDAELRGFPELVKVRNLLQRGPVRIRPKPLSVIIGEGFSDTNGQIKGFSSETKDDNKTTHQKLDTLGKAVAAVGAAVATMHFEMREFRQETKKEFSDLKKVIDQVIKTQGRPNPPLPPTPVPPVDTGIRKTVLSASIASAVLFGVVGGILARFQFGPL